MRRFIAAAALAATLSVPTLAYGQDYPNRLVRLIVNSQAGGTADATTRLLADELSRRWSQSVIVDDVTGAGGNIGAAQALRAEPDGYTLLVSHPGPVTINGLLFKSMAYDPTRVAPVSILITFPNALVVSKSSGLNSLQEFVAYAKANPGKVTYGSQGVGTTTHLAGSLLSERLGAGMIHVPYRGSPAAIIDLTGGRLDMMFDNLGTATPQHKAGATRILAVADDKRSPVLPDVPTMAEAGLPGFRSVTWFGLMAPERTPKPIIDKIQKDVAAVFADPAFLDRLKALSVDPAAMTPEASAQFIAEETVLWSKVVKDARISPVD
jgi:tripartite-type tricarboxylate transporter receptor subunit TctC